MKKNFKQISKRCSKDKPGLILTALVAFAISPFAHAIPAPSKEVSLKDLRSDLARFSQKKGSNFQSIIDRWEDQYGAKATPSLLQLAKDTKAKDTERFIALMALTKISGAQSGPKLVPFLRDKNWMVRSAALKSVEILNYQPASADVLKLLKDPALVIRAQAVAAVETLNPPGAVPALLEAIYDGKNYRPGDYKKGKADWVPQRALASLRKLKPKNVSHQLLPLLNESRDRKLRAHALFTIEALEGKKLKKGSPFKARALAWNQALKPNAITAPKGIARQSAGSSLQVRTSMSSATRKSAPPKQSPAKK